jgi:hypothetical protein
MRASLCLVRSFAARQTLMAGMHALGLKLTSVMSACPPDADT